jgi:hypothetical protein
LVLRCGYRRIFSRQRGVVIAQHDVIEDLAHQGADRRSGTAVFEDHGHRNLGIVIGGEGRHQLVIAQPFGNFMRVIGFVGLQAEDLGRPGFGGDFIRGAGEIFMRRTVAAVGHAVHTVLCQLPEA